MMTTLYDVTITYPDNLPTFYGRVSANNERQAKTIAVYDALAKGFPRTYATIEVKQLKG